MADTETDTDIDDGDEPTEFREPLDLASIHRRPSEQLPYYPTKSGDNPPVVTIFGAGIAGLTAAHELVQRGFNVQVLEPARSMDEPYACDVGGLAKSQGARINETRRLHWPLYERREQISYLMAYPHLERIPEESQLYANLRDDNEQRTRVLSDLRKIRERPLQKVQTRLPFTEAVQLPLKHTTPVDELSKQASKALEEGGKSIDAFVDRYLAELVDWHGEVQSTIGLADSVYANRTKVENVAANVVTALMQYSHDLEEAIVRAGEQSGKFIELPEAVRRRETLLIEVEGIYGEQASASQNIEIGSLMAKIVIAWIQRMVRAAIKGREDAPAKVVAAVENIDAFDHPEWADRVREELLHLEEYLEPIGYPSSERVGAGLSAEERRLLGNVVRFNVIEHVVQGEHGFRFFPAFYRHVFDTMKRTPLLDDRLRVTGTTVYDNLVVPPEVRLGTRDPDSQLKRPAKVESMEDLRQSMEYMEKQFGMTTRDMLRYQVPVLKFLTSCPERRQLFEQMSWAEFVDGKSEYASRSETDGLKPTHYSPETDHMIRKMPQLLVAMTASEGDATTNGAVSTQMMLGMMDRLGNADRMLDGATTPAWLDNWKRYLKRQGVKFFIGGLDRVDVIGEDVLPVISGPGPGGMPLSEDPFATLAELADDEPSSDFFIIAAPYVWTTEAVGRVNGLQQRVGHLEGICADLKNALREKDVTSERVTPLLDRVEEHFWITDLDIAIARAQTALDGKHVVHQVAKSSLATPMYRPAEIDSLDEGLSEWLANRAEWTDDLDSIGRVVRALPLEASLAALQSPGVRALPTFQLALRAIHDIAKHVKLVRQMPRELLRAQQRAAKSLRRIREALEGGRDADAAELTDLNGHLAAWSEEAEDWRGTLLGRLDGDFKRLMDFDLQTGRQDRTGWPKGRGPLDPPTIVPRDPSGMPQPRFSYPLRDLTGLQFYFRDLVQVASGHFVLPFSEWGLSGIAQMALWRTKPSLAYGFLGQLSIDIGTFYDIHAARREREELTAWQCTAEQIARNTWEQITASTPESYAGAVAPPRFYQIDNGLRFAEFGHGPVQRNDNMLMINLPGQWAYRPGLDHSGGARKVKYSVSNKRWVMAGTYMATHTRLTTMEAADESGRHAVNAIINELAETHEPHLYNGGGRFVGDRVETWDIQELEISDFEPLKRLDKQLFDKEVPHFLDVLGVMDVIDRLPNRDSPEDTPLYNLGQVIGSSLDQTNRDWAFLQPFLSQVFSGGLDSVLGDLKKGSEFAEDFIDMLSQSIQANRK